MNIWLLHVGEELPVDENPRLFRYGHLAERLAADGHQVLRWAPTFQHFRKVQRFDCDKRVEVSPNYAIEFLHTSGYAHNISVERYRTYKKLGKRLRSRITGPPQPDLIVSGIPSLEWCEVAVEHGCRHGVPVVLDVRDLWPDVYLQALPRALRPLGRAAIRPIERRTARMFRQATAVYAVSQSYLNWGLAHASRPRSGYDRVFPLGYQPQDSGREKRLTRIGALRSQGVDTSKTICLFAGLIEKSYDVSTVVDCAKQLERSYPGQYQFVICGDGSKAPQVRRAAAGADNVVMLGWVDQETIAAVMSVAAVGLATYTAGAPQSLPNKPFEYMAGGLAIATSLKGELPELLREHRCGATYRPGHATSLASAIRQLTQNRNDLSNMQRRSRRLFESRFHVDCVIRDFADALCDLHRQRSALRPFATA